MNLLNPGNPRDGSGRPPHNDHTMTTRPVPPPPERYLPNAYAELLRFCTTDTCRKKLRYPWVQHVDGKPWLHATNGSVLARVPVYVEKGSTVEIPEGYVPGPEFLGVQMHNEKAPNASQLVRPWKLDEVQAKSGGAAAWNKAVSLAERSGRTRRRPGKEQWAVLSWSVGFGAVGLHDSGEDILVREGWDYTLVNLELVAMIGRVDYMETGGPLDPILLRTKDGGLGKQPIEIMCMPMNHTKAAVQRFKLVTGV